MKCQKHLFQLPDDIHYLNCGYMSPLLRSVEEEGILALQKRRNPSLITPNDFFTGTQLLRERFGQLVNSAANQIAVIPSASYGLQAAVNNIPANKGNHAIVVADEFPSGFYPMEGWCRRTGKELKIISAEEQTSNRGRLWNEKILDSINRNTAAVLLSAVHWTNGTLFDLKSIGERCRETDTVFIVDGTQTVGAMPVDIEACKIDALICAAYKWLLGPYSIGAAFYGERFNNGTPLEESWLNRANAENFSSLTIYTESYKQGAARYSMGENSQFNLIAMFNKSLEQVLEWQPENIQAYARDLSAPLIKYLKDNAVFIEDDEYRAGHLFGFMPGERSNTEDLIATLRNNKIFVSVRGRSIRVSVHVFNTPEDIGSLVASLRPFLRNNS